MNSSATLTGCDDIIKRLREAIAAGPTPGPWMHLVGDRLIYTKLGDGCKGEAVARVDWISGPSYLATLSFIAAASPDNIAALLDRLDKAERENERLREAIGEAYGYLWCVNNEPGTPHQYPPERAAYEARILLRETMTSEQRGTFINRAVALVRGGKTTPPPSTAIDAARAERGKE